MVAFDPSPKPSINPALRLHIRDHRPFIISRLRRLSSRFLCSLSPSSVRPSVCSPESCISKFVLQVAPLLLLLCKLGRRSARTNRRYFTPPQCLCMLVISPLFFIISFFYVFCRGGEVLLRSVPTGACSLVSVFEVLEGSSLLFGTRGSGGGRCQETISGLASGEEGRGGRRWQEETEVGWRLPTSNRKPFASELRSCCCCLAFFFSFPP